MRAGCTILKLLAVATLIGAPVLAAGQTAAPAEPERVSVLVHLEPGVDRAPVRAFAGQHGGRVHYEYAILPDLINLRGIPETALAALERVPGVRRVERDGVMRAHHNDSTPLVQGLEGQLTAAGLSADGSGVRVCILDTGIDSDHIMYTERIDVAAGRDFVNGDLNPEDDNGHGAHVAGSAVGRTGLTVDFGCVGSEPFQGLAPAATLIGVKVLGANGSGNFSDVIAGINYCADQTPSGGRGDVINLSLGAGAFSGTCDSDSAAAAANAAVAAGLVVVASAGNSGNPSALETPACGSQVISVGATYDDNFPSCEFPNQSSFTFCTAVNLAGACIATCTDTAPSVDDIGCYSNRGTQLDVVAPGCIVFSADIGGPNSLVGFCGTSQAAPHVAGLAALLLDLDPLLTPTEVRQLIRDGAVDLGPAGFDTTYGHGRVDVIASLSMVETDCGDGTCASGENACSCPADCGPPASSETVCDNGVDDDCDGSVDCDDFRCSADPVCAPACGDGVCNGVEECAACAADCPSGGTASCGDGVCDAADGEDCVSCATDCNGVQSGPPSGRFCCGQGGSCADNRCNADGFTCSELPALPFCCGDGACQFGETVGTCGIDCSPSAGAVPTTVTVDLQPGGQITVEWSASCVASDADYGVYEGQLGDFTSHVPRFCSTAGATSVSFSPADGDRYYVVVPHNGFREGSHGLTGDDTQRPRGTTSCLPQEVAVCQ